MIDVGLWTPVPGFNEDDPDILTSKPLLNTCTMCYCTLITAELKSDIRCVYVNLLLCLLVIDLLIAYDGLMYGINPSH